MRTLKLYFYGLLILLFVIFVLQNYSTLTYSVALRFNLGFVSLISMPLPLFLVAPLFFFTGLFLATIVGAGERRRLAKELRQLKSGRSEIRPEYKPNPQPETRPEIKNGPKSEPQPEPKPEIKPVAEPKKKPEEGTIVSSGPLFKKSGSAEEPKPPFRS